ncbi:MAG: cytochrome c biogenesis protein [Bdellovibrionia bacterium]
MKSVFLALALLFSSPTFAAQPGEQIKYMPIQEAGRVKPFDTFAKEMLNMVYGKSTLEGREAYEIVLTWMLSPGSWKDKKIFEVKNHQLLKTMGLPITEKYFSGEQLFGNDQFTALRQELANKIESKEKLNPYFQALQRLENQFFVFNEIASGRLLKLVPPLPDTGDSWISVADFNEEQQASFLALTKAFIGHIGAYATGQGDLKKLGEELDQAVFAFEAVAAKNNPALYPSQFKIKTEVHYNNFHPFRWAYIMYLAASLLLLLVWAMNKEVLFKPAWFFVIAGFVIHTYGFALRVYLMERAPVTNMYETVVWVSWGTVLFAAILEWVYKFRFILMAGSLVGLFSLIVADFAPAVLDPSLQPLEAVLRSNYWLVVHVMTITISYAAFFLAFGLGDMGLVYYLLDEEKHKAKIKAIVTSIYRATQIGVAFLAPGIILGGIWADYSWGRFWGWDPKETWALIALLGYIAVLHVRIAGLLKDFGMVVTAVVTFSLVIMAWYGVNYVLGAGLHSYGFGAGGLEYVSGFVIIHFLFALYVWLVRRKRSAA